MRPARLLLALAVLALPLGGCLTTDDGAEPTPTPTPSAWTLPDDFVDPMVMGSNHDHSIAAQHKFVYNMALDSHHPLGGSNLKSSGAHVVDVQNGFLFVGTYGASVDVSGGVYIFDLKDPRKPALAGRLTLPGNVGGDRSMEVNDDAQWMVVGTEPADCAGHANPFGPGIYLVDIRDKARPTITDYRPGSTHSLTIHRVNGQDYVYATYGVPNTQQDNIFKIEKTGPRATLVPSGRVTIGHDSAAFDDPLLQKPLLYAAGGTNYNQLLIYDITNPTGPVKIGTWELEQQERFPNNYVHAISMDLIEGRRILGLESENWGDKPSPVWVLDATDLDDIQRIANWTNPGNVPANGKQPSGGVQGVSSYNGQLTFSTHNPRLEHGILYINHYHGGLWLLNISTLAKAHAPEIMGYYLPHDDNGGFVPRSSEGTYPRPNARCGFDLDEVPIVFDVEVKDGIAYIADMHTGLYVVEYAAPKA